MRIIALDRHPSSKNGGQEWSLVEECAGLSKRGHPLTLCYLTPGDFLSRYRAAGVRTLHVEGVEIESRQRVRSALRLGRSLLRCSFVQSDVVCVNQYHDALFGRAIAAARRVPLVCHLRLMPPDEPCRQWRIGLAGVSRFIAASRAVRDAWSEVPGVDRDAIDVVHDGIDTDRFRPASNRPALRNRLGAPEGAFVIAYAGRIDRMKNIDRLIRAAAALELPADQLCVWIAGRPVDHPSPEAGEEYLRELKQLANSLGLGNQVQWLGPRDDVEELLAAADVSALFSNEEAFGRATVEALACGTPIVAHRPGGTAEILTGEFARFAFDLERPDQAIAILRSCIGLRDRDPGFAVRARDHVLHNFSTTAMVNGIERSLQAVIASSSS